jgi:hypothetical protein
MLQPVPGYLKVFVPFMHKYYYSAFSNLLINMPICILTTNENNIAFLIFIPLILETVIPELGKDDV